MFERSTAKSRPARSSRVKTVPRGILGALAGQQSHLEGTFMRQGAQK